MNLYYNALVYYKASSPERLNTTAPNRGRCGVIAGQAKAERDWRKLVEYSNFWLTDAY